MNNKYDTILQYLEDNEVNIAFISETWLSNSSVIKSFIHNETNFQIFDTPRINSRGGGVCIITSKTLKVSPVNTYSYSSFETVSLELDLKNSTNFHKITLLCLYRLTENEHSTIHFSTFCHEFEDLIYSLINHKYPIMIFGDFNIHLNCAHNPETIKFIDLINEYGLKLVDSGTNTHILGNNLDFGVCTSDIFHYINNKLVDKEEVISDHFPVMFDLNLGAVSESVINKERSYRDFHNIDLDSFHSDLALSLETCSFDSLTSFDSMIKTFNDALLQCTNKHSQIKKSKISHNPRPDWMDQEYILARAQRRKLYKQFCKNRTPINRQLYTNQRTLCSNFVTAKRTNFYKAKMNQCGKNQKKLFKLVNSLLDNNKNKNILPDSSDDTKLANDFNNYFVEKIQKIRSGISHNSEHVRPPYSSSSVNGTLSSFAPTDEAEIKLILSESGFKTSPNDPMPAELMKENIDSLLPYLVKIVNSSLQSGSMDNLKEGIVTPLIKDSFLDRNDLKNYRPITQLSFLSKLIERVVLKRLNSHMMNNNLNCDSQHGYKKHHSTETLLLNLLSDVYHACDQNMGAVVILIDLSAAFDTVDQEYLLKILKNDLGINGTALKWFQSFLTGRFQYTKINDVYSILCFLLYGIPQGSVLGPVLFNIYIRGLKKAFEECGFTSSGYADDNNSMKIFSKFFQYETLIQHVPNCLSNINKWMDEHYLMLNQNKSNVIIFGSDSFLHQINFTGTILDNGKCILFKQNVKLLGVNFDSKLDFNKQINDVVSSCYLGIRNISSIRKYISEEQCEQLVNAFITSKIDYINSLYFGLPKHIMLKLQRVQNASLRLILQLRKRTSVSHYFIQLHWLNIDQRVIFKCLLMIYKCLNGMAPISLCNKITRRESYPPHCFSLKITSYAKTFLGRRSFSFYAPRIWNPLPLYIRNVPSLDNFKTLLKSFLMTNFHDYKQQVNSVITLI